MSLFYIIPPTHEKAQPWLVNSYLGIAPVLINSGEHEGAYAVALSIYESDVGFEAARPILEQFPVAELSQENF